VASILESHPEPETVGPFTGFGNFLRKELRDWWHSRRLLLVFLLPTLIQTLTVFFAFGKLQQQLTAKYILTSPPPMETVGTAVLLQQFAGQSPAFFVIVIIFSTMSLLTREKTTGTLAWNLTKPLGRTGLFVAKWLMATLMLWVGMCILPVVISSICLSSYHHVTPEVAKMVPVLAISVAWIALWVLLMLTISLAFESQAAVGGVGIAFWIVPFLFSVLMGMLLGDETRDWIMDRLATRSPFWAFPLTADKSLFVINRFEEWKEVWLWAYGVTFAALTALSLRVFNRQEVGS
jgi:ABC-type transport system involved in multi-copper enzyme maturation permease subunit